MTGWSPRDMNLMANKRRNLGNLVSVATLFLFAFLLMPFDHLKLLTLMPGDVGDTRLLNYLLENIYLFLLGKSPSLVNLSFFYPFPAVLGFSENLFGSSPAYLIARAVGAAPDTSFQFWYLFGYLVNFASCYYALRRFGRSEIAASIGALIFTFSLPVFVHSGHSQLHYRFGVPLGIAATAIFLKERIWRYFIQAAIWLVWQFYCSIYIGFFLALYISLMILVYIFVTGLRTTWIGTIEFLEQWRNKSFRKKLGDTAAIVALCGAMVLLFYPYATVSILYAAKRPLTEIVQMLPRLESYFFSQTSWLWSAQGKIFAQLPKLTGHQMFIGVVPMMLAAAGIVIGVKRADRLTFQLVACALGLLIVSTIYVGGISLWLLAAQLPLASAMRVMTRIILVFLFPIAYLAAIAIDKLRAHANWTSRLVIAVVIPLLLVEFTTVSAPVSSKTEWRDRLSQRERSIPRDIPEHSILFFAQPGRLWFAEELDAMWVSLSRGYPTLNGYSGIFPPDYSQRYGDDCAELPRRIAIYLNFIGANAEPEAYRSLASRVIPIGFSNCSSDWISDPPRYSIAKRSLTPAEFKLLSLEGGSLSSGTNGSHLSIRIVNSGEEAISAGSSVNTPIHVSWRILSANGTPLSGWDRRIHLPFDVPAHGSVPMRLSIDPKAVVGPARYLEVSIVQERLFWGHDVGVKPLRVELSHDAK